MKHQKLVTTEEVSKRMSSVSLKGGKAETELAHALWHAGIRYRKNYKAVPGSPDITITRYKVAVFVDGEVDGILVAIVQFGERPPYAHAGSQLVTATLDMVLVVAQASQSAESRVVAYASVGVERVDDSVVGDVVGQVERDGFVVGQFLAVQQKEGGEAHHHTEDQYGKNNRFCPFGLMLLFLIFCWHS